MRNDEAIRVADFAQPVHRLMNESYHRFILAQLQRAMEGRGWTFAVTSDQHEIPLLAKAAFARAVYSAQSEYLRPYWQQDSDEFKRSANEAMSEGYAWSWLASILDALAKLGIRPVPNDNLEASVTASDADENPVGSDDR